MNLTEHFTLYELTKSSTATRLEIDNSANGSVIHAGALLAHHVLEPIRAEFGSFSPQSWYRSEELERVIAWKGFEQWCLRHQKTADGNSWAMYFARKSHPRGEAADIEIVGVANDALFKWIHANLEFDQLIREFPGENPMSGWVHVSYRENNNRKEVFSIPWRAEYAL